MAITGPSLTLIPFADVKISIDFGFYKPFCELCNGDIIKEISSTIVLSQGLSLVIASTLQHLLSLKY